MRINKSSILITLLALATIIPVHISAQEVKAQDRPAKPTPNNKVLPRPAAEKLQTEQREVREEATENRVNILQNARQENTTI